MQRPINQREEYPEGRSSMVKGAQWRQADLQVTTKRFRQRDFFLVMNKKANHHFNFFVEFGIFDHGNKEDGASHRMAGVNEFLEPSLCQYVIDDGRDVECSDFVPPVHKREMMMNI